MMLLLQFFLRDSHFTYLDYSHVLILIHPELGMNMSEFHISSDSSLTNKAVRFTCHIQLKA